VSSSSRSRAVSRSCRTGHKPGDVEEHAYVERSSAWGAWTTPKRQRSPPSRLPASSRALPRRPRCPSSPPLCTTWRPWPTTGATPQASIAPLSEEIEILRPLVRERREAFEPTLASAEANLADAFADTGRPAEALLTIDGTLERHLRVVEADPERFLGELLRLMNNRVFLLDESGDQSAAAAAREELAALRRWLKSVVDAGPV
jgi:hypothetical protein